MKGRLGRVECGRWGGVSEDYSWGVGKAHYQREFDIAFQDVAPLQYEKHRNM